LSRRIRAMGRRRLSFDAWCDEVDRLCREQLAEHPLCYTLAGGREQWRDIYLAGETPQSVVDGEIDARRDSL